MPVSRTRRARPIIDPHIASSSTNGDPSPQVRLVSAASPCLQVLTLTHKQGGARPTGPANGPRDPTSPLVAGASHDTAHAGAGSATKGRKKPKGVACASLSSCSCVSAVIETDTPRAQSPPLLRLPRPLPRPSRSAAPLPPAQSRTRPSCPLSPRRRSACAPRPYSTTRTTRTRRSCSRTTTRRWRRARSPMRRRASRRRWSRETGRTRVTGSRRRKTTSSTRTRRSCRLSPSPRCVCLTRMASECIRLTRDIAAAAHEVHVVEQEEALRGRKGGGDGGRTRFAPHEPLVPQSHPLFFISSLRPMVRVHVKRGREGELANAGQRARVQQAARRSDSATSASKPAGTNDVSV